MLKQTLRNPSHPQREWGLMRDYAKDNIEEYMQLDINGYEGLYAIDTNGKIFSYPKSPPLGRPYLSFRCLKTRITRHGYEQVSLRLNNKNKLVYIHRLVAETFIPNPENKPQVNHIDGNKQNNHVSNLEWCTSRENQLHAYKMGLKTPSIRECYPTGADNCLSKKVRCIETGEIYDSARIASESLGLFRQQVTTAISRNGCAGGFHWEHYNPEEEIVLKVGDRIEINSECGNRIITKINYLKSVIELDRNGYFSFSSIESDFIVSVNGRQGKYVIPPFNFKQTLLDAGFTNINNSPWSYAKSGIAILIDDINTEVLMLSKRYKQSPANAKILIEAANILNELEHL